MKQFYKQRWDAAITRGFNINNVPIRLPIIGTTYKCNIALHSIPAIRLDFALYRLF